MPIFFVHGRSQQGHDDDKLHAKWRASLFESGASRAGVRFSPDLQSFFPYYGDELMRYVTGVGRKEEDGLRSARSTAEKTDIQSELLEELAEILRVRAAASGLRVPGSWHQTASGAGPDDFRSTSKGAGGIQEATRGFASVLSAVNSAVPQISGVVVFILRDVAAYLGDSNARSAVHAILSESFQRCSACS